MPGTEQSIVINASINDVWSKVNNFHNLSWAANVIPDVKAVGDVSGTEAGAQRELNGVFKETLRSVDADNYTLTYSIDDGPSPVSKEEVSNYIGIIKLSEQSDGTLVEWTSSWESNVEDAVEFCHTIYVALLGALKTSFE